MAMEGIFSDFESSGASGLSASQVSAKGGNAGWADIADRERIDADQAWVNSSAEYTYIYGDRHNQPGDRAYSSVSVGEQLARVRSESANNPYGEKDPPRYGSGRSGNSRGGGGYTGGNWGGYGSGRTSNKPLVPEPSDSGSGTPGFSGGYGSGAGLTSGSSSASTSSGRGGASAAWLQGIGYNGIASGSVSAGGPGSAAGSSTAAPGRSGLRLSPSSSGTPSAVGGGVQPSGIPSGSGAASSGPPTRSSAAGAANFQSIDSASWPSPSGLSSGLSGAASSPGSRSSSGVGSSSAGYVGYQQPTDPPAGPGGSSSLTPPWGDFESLNYAYAGGPSGPSGNSAGSPVGPSGSAPSLPGPSPQSWDSFNVYQSLVRQSVVSSADSVPWVSRLVLALSTRSQGEAAGLDVPLRKPSVPLGVSLGPWSDRSRVAWSATRLQLAASGGPYLARLRGDIKVSENQNALSPPSPQLSRASASSSPSSPPRLSPWQPPSRLSQAISAATAAQAIASELGLKPVPQRFWVLPDVNGSTTSPFSLHTKKNGPPGATGTPALDGRTLSGLTRSVATYTGQGYDAATALQKAKEDLAYSRQKLLNGYEPPRNSNGKPKANGASRGARKRTAANSALASRTLDVLQAAASASAAKASVSPRKAPLSW